MSYEKNIFYLGTLMGFIRYINGAYSVRLWGSFGTLMGCIRYVCGAISVRLWGVFGTFMGFR